MVVLSQRWVAVSASAWKRVRTSKKATIRLMPKAPPSWRMKFATPEPWRTLSGGRAFSEEALRLGLMRPSPSRDSMIMPTRVQKVVSTSAVVIQAKPAVNSTRPIMIMTEAGMASLRRPASGKMKASMMPAGIIIRPASSGVKPMMVCTNTGMM